MRSLSGLRNFLSLVILLLLSTSAPAQIFRAYLSIDGNDANPCTLAAPCRLLPAAIYAVAPGGEVWMLDSANYNTTTVSVAKSVTILAVPGAVGSVVAAGGPAISVFSPGGINVTLRNLVIVPLAGAGGTYGVQLTDGSMLSIEETVIANLTQHAVIATGSGRVSITNSTIRNNGGYGVWVEAGAQGEVSGTKLRNNAGGVMAMNSAGDQPTTTLTLSDSVISGGTYGAYALAVGSGKTARVNVSRSTIEGTGDALKSDSFSTGLPTVSVSSSMIVNNANAWSIVGPAFVVSGGNNHFHSNTSFAGGLTAMPLQ